MNASSEIKGTSRGWLLWVIVAPCAFVALLFVVSPNFKVVDTPNAEPFGGDFLQEWLGGYIVIDGDHARFYDVKYAQSLQHDRRIIGFDWDESGYLPIVYPPFYYLLLSPLSRLPLTAAARLWCVLMVACLVGTAILLGAKDASARRLLAGSVPLCLLFVPLIEDFNSCQKGTLVLLLITATYVLLKRNRCFWAGVVFGFVAFKPQLTLVIAAAMILKREWRFVLGGMTTGLVLLGLSALVGLDVCRQYVQFALGTGSYLHTAGYDLTKAHCWSGACHLLFAGFPDPLIKAAALLPTAATIAVLCRILRGRLEFGRPGFAVQYSALVVGTVLLSPHLLTYDLTILLLPMFLLARVGMDARCFAVGELKTIGGVLAALFVLAGVLSPLAAATRIQPSVILMFALLVLLSRRPLEQPAALRESRMSPSAA